MHVLVRKQSRKATEGTPRGTWCSVNSKLYLHKQIFGDAAKSLLSFRWTTLLFGLRVSQLLSVVKLERKLWENSEVRSHTFGSYGVLLSLFSHNWVFEAVEEVGPGQKCFSELFRLNFLLTRYQALVAFIWLEITQFRRNCSSILLLLLGDEYTKSNCPQTFSEKLSQWMLYVEQGEECKQRDLGKDPRERFSVAAQAQ